MALNADEATITFSEQGYSNGQEVTSATLDDYITLTFNKGTNSNAPKYYNMGTALRIYGGGTMTVTGSSSAVTINSVTLTTQSGDNTVNSASTVSAGTLAIDGTAATITSVNANSTTFTQGGSSGHVRILTVTVDYTVGAATNMSTPTFTPASGEITADTKISIACTDEANIYYTIDGTEPSASNGTLYEAPFTLSADATVKAVAVDPNGTLANSNVAEATYKFPVANIAEFISKANSYATTISGAVTVVAQEGSYLFLQDATGKIVAFGSLGNTTYSNGDQLTGVKGTYTRYNGLPQMTPETASFGTATTGTAVEPTVITLDALADTELLTYVKVTGVTVPESSKSCTITDATGTATMYNSAGITVTTGENLTVEGFVSCYNTTIQLLPINITSASGLKVVEAPVINPNGGTIASDAEIEITCATEGASIYYTIDGTEPSADNGTLYEAPFTLSADATVKAIAIADGMANSSVAEAAFTLMSANLKVATFNFTDPTSLNPVQEVPATGGEVAVNDVTFTNGAVSLTCAKNDASTNCRLYNSNGSITLRTYKKSSSGTTGSTITISVANAAITNISFNGATSSDFEANVGTFSSSTWTGEATEVVFTTIANATIKGITVTYDITTGVEETLVDDNAPVEYYNLQGMKVANPENGIFIKKQGIKVTKVIL